MLRMLVSAYLTMFAVALLRPGRIDTHLFVDRPTAPERRAVLWASMGLPPAPPRASPGGNEEEASLGAVVDTCAADGDATQWLSYADLVTIGNKCLLAATREESDPVLPGETARDAPTHAALRRHLLRLFPAYRPSMKAADLSSLDAIYSDFARHDSKGTAEDNRGGKGQKVSLK